jgi:hypothetical protein
MAGGKGWQGRKQNKEPEAIHRASPFADRDSQHMRLRFNKDPQKLKLYLVFHRLHAAARSSPLRRSLDRITSGATRLPKLRFVQVPRVNPYL